MSISSRINSSSNWIQRWEWMNNNCTQSHDWISQNIGLKKPDPKGYTWYGYGFIYLQKVQKQAKPICGVRSQNCIQRVGFCKAFPSFNHCFQIGLLCTFQWALLGPVGFCNSDLSNALEGVVSLTEGRWERFSRGQQCVFFFPSWSECWSQCSVYQSVHISVHLSKWKWNQGIHAQKRDER